LLAFLVAAPAPAAEESPLAQVPAKSAIVVKLRGVKAVKDRLATMVKNAMPDLGPVVQAKIDDFLKEGVFQGRQVKGLPDAGPIFLVFPSLPLKFEGDAPNLALIVRVTDYKTFRDGFLKEEERKSIKEDKQAGYEVATIDEQPVYLIDRKGYAVFTSDKATAAELAKNKTKGLDSTLAKGLAGRLMDSDLAAYVDLAAVNKAYAEKIKTGKTFLDDALERLEGIGGFDKGQAEMVKAIFNGLFQAFEDSKSLLVSVEFRPEGLALHTRVDFREDTVTGQLLRAMKPSPLDSLKTLPADFTSYSAFDFGPAAFKAFGSIFKGVIASPSEEEEADKAQAKAIQKALDEMIATNPRSLATGSRLGSGNESLMVWQVGDPAKLAAAQVKLFKALKGGGKYAFAPLKDKPVVKTDAAKYRGAGLNHVSLKWDLEKLAESLPTGGEQAAGVMKEMLGEGMNLWFGPVDKVYVQVSAKDWKTAQKYLDDYFSKKNLIGDERHKAFERARAQLPREASFVSLTNVPDYVQFMAGYMFAVLKEPLGLTGKPPAPPAKKVPPSYMGMAMTLKAGQSSFDLWIPGAMAREVRRAIEAFKPQQDD
jgi:hypothetical protein